MISQVKTRSGVEVVKRTNPAGREIIESFHAALYKKLKDASLVQIRVLAEESRELIVDRLYAARPQAPGAARVARPQPLRRSDIPTTDRRAFRHPKLADRTVKGKAAVEKDGRKIIATGEYTYGIEVFRGERAGQPYYIVRPKPGMHSEAGVTHRVLAAFHEFGTKKMPKRPHWGTALNIVKRVLRERGEDVRAEALRTAIRGVR